MERLVARMERVQDWIAFGFISVMTVCVSLQVFVRYVLQKPMFLWSEELTRFVLIWTVFLGIGVGVKNDGHFAMDVLPPLFVAVTTYCAAGAPAVGVPEMAPVAGSSESPGGKAGAMA